MKVTQNKKRVTQEEKKQVKAVQTVAEQDPEAVYEVVMNPGKRNVRDGSDILSEVTYKTIPLSCLSTLIYQFMEDTGLNQDKLTEDQEVNLVFKARSLSNLLTLTASTIDMTMEQIEHINPFIFE